MSIRQTKIFRRFRRGKFVHNFIRPVYSKNMVLNWWSLGRPVPPPHEVKMGAILYLADRLDANIFIETGSYLGDTVRALRGRFDQIYSIELSPELGKPLIDEFKSDRSVEIVVGDSGVEVKNLLSRLEGTFIFWLDAHYSGGQTVGSGYVPIFDEITSIANSLANTHAILIDDIVDFTGKDGYPTEEQLFKFLIDLGYEVASFNNIMQAIR